MWGSRFKKHAVTQDSIAARVVLALVLPLLESHGQGLQSEFDKPRHCPMRTCQHECFSPWQLINHLLVCPETSKGEVQCPECDPVHEKRLMSPVYHLWRRLSSCGRKHSLPTSPGLSQPSKRNKFPGEDEGSGIGNDFQPDQEIQPPEMYGSAPPWELGGLGALGNMHFPPPESETETLQRVTLELDATQAFELPAPLPGRESLFLDTSHAVFQAPAQPWSGESGNSTLWGSLPSGSTEASNLRFASPHSTIPKANAYHDFSTLGHSQYIPFIDPKLLTGLSVSGGALTASPDMADIPESRLSSRLAPWETQPFDHLRAPATTDFVADHYNNPELTPRSQESATTCDGIAYPGLALADSQGGGQMNWPLAIPLTGTSIRTVYERQEGGAEEARAVENTVPISNDFESNISTSSISSKPGPRGLLPRTTVSTINAPATMVLTRRKATRQSQRKTSSITLETAVSEEQASSGMPVSLEADADSCPLCSYRARGKKNRLTHLRRHMKTHQNLKKLECPVPGCTSGFAAGRKDNLQHHLHKVHRLHAQDVLVSTPTTNTTQTMSLGSDDSSEESQSVQGGKGETEDLEEGHGESFGTFLGHGQSDLLNGIFFERDTMLNEMQASGGVISAVDLEDELDMNCERPADLPATAWNAENGPIWT